MVWFNIRVGSYFIKYMPFKEGKKIYPYCDSKGNILKRVSGKVEKGYFINEATGEKHEKAFILINNKPFDRFARTKETDKYKEVDEKEVFDLVNPKMYLCECPRLLKELQETKKALKFGISFGGQQSYLAYIFVNPLYNELFMYVGNAKISEQMTEIKEIQKNKNKLKEMSLIVQGIDKAKAEDLIVL